MNRTGARRIALLFRSDDIYGRQIVAGVSDYLRSTAATWDLFLEPDLDALTRIGSWQGDGFIADFNEAGVRRALATSPVPTVAVGCSYARPADYPACRPYVASDNDALIRLAWQQLADAGLQNFALFSLPADCGFGWVPERERAFAAVCAEQGLAVQIHRGRSGNSPSWSDEGRALANWLHALPKPVGIVAISDSRARQLLQACLMHDIPVPAEVAVIGIDDDPLARVLSRIPLSSVIQGTHAMGQLAARLLHDMLDGRPVPAQPLLVPPAGVNLQTSSARELARSLAVRRARHFIRLYACQGIKADQVAGYVGVARSTLEVHFRAELGCSVHDDILRFKLEIARRLLDDATIPMADVASRCGFTSSSYLHSVFKRELGCTPTQYRLRQRALPE